MIKKYLTEKNMVALVLSLILLHPILDLDHILYPYLDALGLPLPSTGLHFIVLPLFVLVVFFFIEPNKKKMGFLFGLYGVMLAGYFYQHHLFVKDLFDQLYLTNRYVYSVTTEFRYVLTLIIPYGLVYAFYRTKLNSDVLKRVVVITSALISIPLVLSNLFLFGPSTYVGKTMANFPYWFFGIYDIFHPRQLATKFFFSEGNTTGILLFGLYPMLISIYLQAKKYQWSLLGLIIIQGLAMYVLATRVATFGVPIMLGVMIALVILILLLKLETIQKQRIGLLSIVFVIFLSIYPFTPAVVNQTIDAENNGFVFSDENDRMTAKDYVIDGAKELIPGSAEYNYYYMYIFRDYAYFLTIPSIYYEWYYPYQIDAKWYVDLIFEVPLEQRASGRQFQRIFSDYKFNQLDSTQKLFGYSYSMFMNGSILLEQDFMMQKYTFGYLGVAILLGPWLALLAWIAVLFLRRLKQNFNLETLSIGLFIGAILGGAYMSGHVLDQFFTTTYLAFGMAYLLQNLTDKNA